MTGSRKWRKPSVDSFISRHRAAAAGSDPLDGVMYHERRWFGGTEAIIFVMLVAAAVFMLVSTARRDPESLATVALGYLALAALVVVIVVSPVTVWCGHIHIDRSGLAVWWPRLVRLPAAEIGDVVIVAEEEAGPAARRGRYRNLKIGSGRSSYSVWGGMGRAVFVEQRRVGKPVRGWLVATRDPEGVVAALERVRDGR